MADQAYGPVEIVLVGLGETKPSPALAAALTDALETRAVRLVDVVFISRDADGSLRVEEVDDVSDEYGFGEVELDASGLAGGDDLDELAEQVPPGTSAVVVVFEHVWARALGTALAAAGGVVVSAERISAPVVNTLINQIRS